MKKTRIKKPVTDATTIDIELVIGQIAGLKNSERKLTAAMDQRIQAIRDDYADDLAHVADNLAVLIARAQAWAEANPDKFAKRKSLELTHGTVGFRTGTPKLALLNKKWNWKTALNAVCNLLPNFIRQVPEIDKEALIAQRDEESIRYALPRCGLKVTQDESFFVEPNLTPLDNRETLPTRSEALVA